MGLFTFPLPAVYVLILPGMAYPSCEKVAMIQVLFNVLILAVAFSAAKLQRKMQNSFHHIGDDFDLSDLNEDSWRKWLQNKSKKCMKWYRSVETKLSETSLHNAYIIKGHTINHKVEMW